MRVNETMSRRRAPPGERPTYDPEGEVPVSPQPWDPTGAPSTREIEKHEDQQSSIVAPLLIGLGTAGVAALAGRAAYSQYKRMQLPPHMYRNTRITPTGALAWTPEMEIEMQRLRAPTEYSPIKSRVPPFVQLRREQAVQENQRQLQQRAAAEQKRMIGQYDKVISELKSTRPIAENVPSLSQPAPVRQPRVSVKKSSKAPRRPDTPRPPARKMEFVRRRQTAPMPITPPRVRLDSEVSVRKTPGAPTPRRVRARPPMPPGAGSPPPRPFVATRQVITLRRPITQKLPLKSIPKAPMMFRR